MLPNHGSLDHSPISTPNMNRPLLAQLKLTHLPPVHFKFSSLDPEKAEQRGRPTNPRALSWDRLRQHRDHSAATSEDGTQTPKRRGTRTPEWEGFDFNPAQSSVEQLRYAEGDVGKSKVCVRTGVMRTRECAYLRWDRRDFTAGQIILLSSIKFNLHSMVPIHLPSLGGEPSSICSSQAILLINVLSLSSCGCPE